MMQIESSDFDSVNNSHNGLVTSAKVDKAMPRLKSLRPYLGEEIVNQILPFQLSESIVALSEMSFAL